MQSNNKQIPPKPNYKLTKLGWIPEEWKMKHISDYGEVFTGNTPPTGDYSNYGNKYLFVSPVDLGINKYISKTKKKLSDKGFQKSRKFAKGSVLFTCIGSTIGKVGIATEDLTSNQQINAIIVNENNCNEFLYYQLEKNSSRIKLLAGEQAVPIINKTQFESINILSPPLPEQKAIAQCLSTWDKAIHTLQKLIAQKQARKKWLMQVLLTGKLRLRDDSGKAFEEEWRDQKLSDTGTIVTGSTPSMDNKSNYGDEFCWATAIDFKSKYINDTVIKLSSIGKAVARKVPKGSVLITCIASIGKNAITNRDMSFNQQINAIVPFQNYNAEFLYYQIDYSPNLLLKYAGAGAVPIINKETFGTIRITVPSYEEQTAIVNVLQTADKEIDLLQQKLEKLKEQKKGLMQVLLPGKKRLV